ncbi:MAG TPA: hypothetical protein VFY28_00160, partial [Candidatus Paceibacterota bacterium]|nr:hypothetical protein [Candidatus Paceibacterota bacterium]
MNPLLEKNLISTKEASVLSGYHSDYLARMARTGKIVGTQVGRTWLVSRDSVEQFMREQEERKREIAGQLAKTRETEYRRLHPELAAPVVAQNTPVETAAVKEPVMPDVSPRPVPVARPLGERRALPSPYVSTKDIIVRHAIATVAMLAIVGGASAVAVSDLPTYASERSMAIASQASPIAILASIGEATNTMVARAVLSAPSLYERATYAWVDASLVLASRAGDAQVAVARHAESIAYHALTPRSDRDADAVRYAKADAPAVEAQKARLSVASPLAAWSPSLSLDVPQTFAATLAPVARATYRAFFGLYDFAGYTFATITKPYFNTAPVLVIEERPLPASSSASATTSITYAGDTTVVQNITNTTVTEGVSREYVDKLVSAIGRGVGESIGSVDTTVSGDISVDSLTVATGASVGAGLTVAGDADIAGTLTVGNFTVSTLNVTSALVGPYFTATSTTATSSFAGGLFGARIEAGDYLAGPYVLATSTTATSVFSGNIAVSKDATLGTAASDTLTVNASIGSHLIPSVASTYDLGSTARAWRAAYVDSIIATNASSTNATSTNFATTNFRLGGDLFTSLLGTGLSNVGGALTVATSTLGLDTSFFEQGGNSFGATSTLGSLDTQPLQFLTNGIARITVDTSGRVGISTSTPGSLFAIGGIANFTSATSTLYGSGGINITSGCFAVNGTCVSGSGGGAVSSVFGRTGAVIAQIGDYTTDEVTEGSNLYWTNTRFDNRLSATTTLPNLTTLANLSTVSTSLTGLVKATAGVLSSAVAGTDYESPLTFTYPLQRVTNAISLAFGTTTANTWGALQTFTSGITSNALTIGSLTGPLQAVNGVVSATSTLSTAYGGTGLSTAPTYGQLLVGNASGGYTLTATSSLGLASTFTATYPIQYSNDVLSLAFGTTTANTWSQLQTFSDGITTSGTVTLGTNSGVLYGNGGVVSSVATSTATLGLGLSGTLTTLGGGDTLSVATSSLYTWGTGISDAGGVISNSGVLSVAQTYGSAQTGAITIASSTSGTDFSITNSSGTFTFNLPTASASARGLLSSTDWSTFNSKQAALTFTYPLQNAANIISLAFGTTTSNTWAGTQTFTNPIVVSSGTSTFGGNIEVTGDVIPAADDTYSLGRAD